MENSVLQNNYVPINDFRFMDPFEDESTNGLYINDIYLPQEIITNILSYLLPRNVLRSTLVCKKWCNIIKSENFWMNIYNKRYPSKAKRLPWYVYYCYFTTNNFEENLLKNGNGQEDFKDWEIISGDHFKVESTPCGTDPLPSNVPEFNGNTSCFASSFAPCNKLQIISLKNKRLLRYILNKFRPHIYVSEWFAKMADCECAYQLSLKGYHENFHERYLHRFSKPYNEGSLFHQRYLPSSFANRRKHPGRVNEGEDDRSWKKAELLIKKYPPGVAVLIFEHEDRGSRYWTVHDCGSKMAGGVVRILFDSIDPLEMENK